MKLLMTIPMVVALSAETKMKLADLPPAVQTAVKEQTQAATLLAVSKETQNGKTVYEVETKVGDKTRDLMLNGAGNILSVEEEVDLNSVPAPAKAAFVKRAAGGSVTKVEKVSVGSAVSYEAAMTLKTGKKMEVALNADGSLHK